MKTSELKKIVCDNGCKYNSVNDWINIRKQDDELITYIDEKNVNIFQVYDACPKVIAQAILDYAYTPLEEREENEKFILQLPFHSSNEEEEDEDTLWFNIPYKEYHLGFYSPKYQDRYNKCEFTQKEINALPKSWQDFFEKVEIK